MEYRRRRRRARARRRSGSAGASGGGSAGGAIITLLLIAGIVYIIASSDAGEWVAKNVMAPAVAFFAGDKTGQKDPDDQTGGQPGETDGAASIDLSEGDAAPASAELTFPGVQCYMLQLGAFTSEDNAEALAATMQARGGGGYVLEDVSGGETRYRVMAAGYEDYESAKSVKDRLVAEGTDCTIYTLMSASAVFRVTAPKDSMAGVRAGFDALANARKSLEAACIGFDRDGLTVAQGKEKAGEILAALETEMEPLASFAPDGGALSHILDAYAALCASLETLAGGEYESTVDFSAAMKYTYLNITDQYAALTEALAG
ncbi:MAG: Sporulation related domain protein [Firmicutes bacterium ADurb.Bin248]|nr:MAG: Sporulation related domain protein [Firmicutes bacterium ADurb.Bin248]HOG00562.1 SPOR domain-containing protein [Clostridia bacterium]HPK14775.1 SPOR domain-containing protein [Clostridia bacterium]